MPGEYIREALQRAQLQPYQRLTSQVARGRDHWAHVTGRAGAKREDFCLHVLQQRKQLGRLSQALSAPSGPPVAAYVDHNRWGARCECGGFEVIERGEPFYCFSCYNADNGGAPRPVLWPSRADETRVERILMARADPVHRTWYVWEPLDFLEQENLLHGEPRALEV